MALFLHLVIDESGPELVFAKDVSSNDEFLGVELIHQLRKHRLVHSGQALNAGSPMAFALLLLHFKCYLLSFHSQIAPMSLATLGGRELRPAVSEKGL